ncbi:MAG: DUF1540 domain-containing protein [Myxococcaceae bacterium]
MNGLPPVSRCDVTACFYNRVKACHAPAINVGSSHPSCDAFIAQPNHIARQETGMVGACHVSDCRFNTELTCKAGGITVAEHSGHADCATFQRR